MFTKADFSRSYRILCKARVYTGAGRGGIVTGHLLRWPASGEMAWASHTRIVWPEHVHVYPFIHAPRGVFLSEEIPR